MSNNPKSKICVIDDEVDQADLCAEFLSDDSEVRTFYNAETALYEVVNKGFRPGVIITDLKMPGMDGLQLVEALKKESIDTPVIMVSGFLEKNHTLKGIDLGISNFLEKPFDISKLKELVEKVCRQHECMKLKDQILGKQGDEISSLALLKSRYLERYTTAENALYEAKIEVVKDLKAAKVHLENNRVENMLEREVEKLESEIKSLNMELSNLSLEMTATAAKLIKAS